MKKTFTVLIFFILFLGCKKSPKQNKNWSDGSPKIRIEIYQARDKLGDTIFRKYVKHFIQNEEDTLLNFDEDWYNIEDQLFLSRQIRNGELNGLVQMYNDFGFVKETSYYNNGEPVLKKNY